MRRIFYIFIILITADNSFGQTDSIATKKPIFGINIGVFISPDLYDFNYYGLLTVEQGRNFFAIGPIIGHKLKLNSYYFYATPYDRQIGLNGFNLVYQINPNPKGKIFDFFFQNQFSLLYYKDSGIDDLFNNANEPYKSHQINITDYLGIGYKVKFLKRFYFIQSIGVGLFYKHLLIDYANLPDNDDLYFGPSLTTNIGLGYVFDRKK